MEGWILIVVLCMVGRTQSAIDNSGTEFMIGLMDNKIFGDKSFDVEFYVTTVSNNVVEVTITTPLYDASWVTKVNATRRNIANFTVPTGIRGDGIALEGKGIYISATEEVTVYCVNKESYSTDAFIAYPIDSVGTDYIAVTWDVTPEIMVAGITDGTDVTFKISSNYSSSFTYSGVTYSAGDSLTVTVNRYQTFHIYSASGDLTGTRITSTNPVSAFSGNFKTIVRDTTTKSTADHLVEQLVATKSLGKEFISFAMPERTIGDYVRIVAAEDSTTYSIDGASYTLNMNMYNTHNLPSSSYYWISSDKGISVVMFSKTEGLSGYNDAPKGGDPCMSLGVPVALFGSDYTWSTVTTTFGDFNSYILIVSLATYTSDLVLDDVSLTANWTPVIGNSDYVGTFVTISPGAHSIYNSVPIHGFLGMAMGNAPMNSYAYASGLRLASINQPCHTTSTTHGDGYDNDCDGRIDEEVENGVDDDNDGLIDEDLALGVRVNGEWGNWAAWGTCSNTCGSGSGVYVRSHACDNPAPANFGLDCVGDDYETGVCTGPSSPCPINGEWGNWAAWGTCSNTCGSGSGVYVRSHVCDNPAPANFGLDCVGDDYETGVCTGPSSPCPIDGSWGQWGNWSVCSVTCDSGLQLRTRPCDNPEPQYGGLKCTGDSTENTTCDTSEYCLPVFYGNPLSGCTANKFACANGSACIDIALRCDGQVDCADGTDESHFYTGCALSERYNKSRASVLHASVSMVMLALLLMLVKE